MSYLDGDGLATLWAKIKQYVSTQMSSGIPDLGVVTSKLADYAVTTIKIASGAITADKLESNMFVAENRTITSGRYISADGGWYSDTISVAKTGYKAVGIAGWYMSGTNSRWCVPEEIYINPNSQNFTAYIWNQNTGAAATITLIVSILYIKTS